MMIPFLPEGAHAIIVDYYEKDGKPLFGTRKNTSVSMESPFWNYWPHVKKVTPRYLSNLRDSFSNRTWMWFWFWFLILILAVLPGLVQGRAGGG